MHAELDQLLLAYDARRVHVDQEEREAVVSGIGVGLGHQHDEVGTVAVGDERLGPVDDVLVTVAHRSRLDPRDVGARVGLGDAQAGDLLAPDGRRQVTLLLILGAEGENRGSGHVGVDGDAHGQAARVRLGHLLGQHEVAVVVAALAAVALGHRQTQEAELSHAREDPVLEGLLLPALGVGGELLLHEAPDRLAQPVMVLGEDEVAALGAEVGLQQPLGGGGVGGGAYGAGHVGVTPWA